MLIPCMAPAAEQQIGMHDAAATSLAAALGSGLLPAMLLYLLLRHANAFCLLVLAEYSLTGIRWDFWLDELSWQNENL